MADFIPYEDIVTILYGPNPNQKLKDFWKSMETMTKAEFARMRMGMANELKEQFASMSNEITAQSVKMQSSITAQIGMVKQLKTAEAEKLSQIDKLAQATSKEALSIEKIKQATAQANTERKREAKIMLEQEGSYKKLSLELQKNIDKYKSLSRAKRDDVNIGGQLLKTIQGQQTELKRMDASMGNFQRNVGNYRSALEGLPGPIGAVVSRTGQLTSSVGKLGPIGIGVAAILTGLAAPLIAFFTKSEQGAELLERKLAGIKASLGVMVGELIRGGDALTESLQKTKESTFWTKFLSVFGPSGTSLGVRMDMANKSAQEYTKTLQELEDLERSMLVPRAQANKQIAEAKLLYEDESRSIEDRIQALKTSLQLEISTLNNEIEFQDRVIDNIRKINEEKKAAGQLRDEDDRKLQEALARRIELETESMTKQRKLQSTINNAYDEMIRQQQAINKEIMNLSEIFTEWQKEVDDSMKTSFSDVTAQVKSDMDAIDAGLKALIQQYEDHEREYNQFLDKMGISRQEEQEIELELLQEALDRKAITEKQYLTYRAAMWVKNNRELLDAIQEFNSSFLNLLSELNAGQIQSAQKEVDIQEDKINSLQSQLDKEKALKDEGKANDYDRLVDQIAQSQKLRDDANKKLERAQKREAQIQLAAQASDMITASANIIEGWTEVNPIYGVILGLAAVASMIAAFAAYKNKINSISKYGEGEIDIDGKSHKEGGKIVEIEGHESIIKKSATAKSKKLLTAINDGVLSDVDLFKLNFNHNLGDSNYQRYDSTAQMLSELRKTRTANEILVKHFKEETRMFQLKDGRFLLLKGSNNTQIITIE